MESEGLNLTSVGKRFGLTSHGAGQWVRGYYAFNQASESSDYINEVDERSYTFFQELFGKSCVPLREWLDWDEDKNQFKNLLNFNEFIGWLYPKEDVEEGGNTGKGDWEKRKLVRRDDLRTLSYLMTKSHEHFIQFRNGADLEMCYSSALAKKYEEEAKRNTDVIAEVFNSIKTCTQALSDVPFRAIKDPSTKSRLFLALEPLEKAISDIKS